MMLEPSARSTVELVPLLRFPLIASGDRLPEIIRQAVGANGMTVEDGDVLVVAQKIVSKAEGRMFRLSEVVPSPNAVSLGMKTGKDPRLVQLILQESVAVRRAVGNLIITEHRLGMVMANAGVDQSNVDEGHALLLPLDPDRSAREIRDHLAEHERVSVGVIVADSIGRAWRNGIVGHAIGVAGVTAVRDLRGTPDLNGRPLLSSETAVADEIAAAASLLMGQAAEGRPVVLVRGLDVAGDGSARDLIRSPERDLFP